ncbi:MAG: LemA family protein [Baekduia sp.]
MSGAMGRQDTKQAVDTAWAMLDAALTRRAELVPALIAAVRVNAPHEKAPCDNVEATLTRTIAAASASGPEERHASEDELQIALSGLERVGDAYSEVRAAPDYKQAQDALFFARKEIREATETYNAAVAEHNAGLGQSGGRFPWSRGGGGEPAAFFGEPES